KLSGSLEQKSIPHPARQPGPDASGLRLASLLFEGCWWALHALTLSSRHLWRSLLLVRYSQRSVFGIDDEDGQKARRIPVTRILTDPVMRARRLVEAFADVVDFNGLIVNLASNGT